MRLLPRHVLAGLLCLGPLAPVSAYAETASDLTLRQAVQLTLQYNPELATYPWDVRAAEARMIQAGLRPNPELSLEVEDIQIGGNTGATKARTWLIAGSGNIDVAREQIAGALPGFREAQCTVTLSQVIELGGKRSRRITAVAREKTVAELDYEVARVKILAEMTKAYVQVVADQECLTLRSQLRDLAAQVRQATQARVESGKVSPLDLNRVQTEETRARIALEKSEKALLSSRIKLSSYWAETEPTFVRAAGNLNVPDKPPLPQELELRIETAPEIRRWTAEIEQRQAAVTLEKAQAVPDVTASLGWRVQRVAAPDHSSLGFGTQGIAWTGTNVAAEDDIDHRLVAQVSVPLPIFNRNQGNIVEARSKLGKAEAELANGRNSLLSQLKILNQDLISIYNEWRAIADEIMPNVSQSFAGVEEGYRQGKFDLLDVLDAQEVLFKAKVDFVEAAQSYQKTLTEMEKLMGEPLAAQPRQGNES